MKRCIIFFAAVIGAMTHGEPVRQFRGSVVNGLGFPVSNALVRVYERSYMTIDGVKSECLAVTHTGADGGFSGIMTGDLRRTTCCISRQPYEDVWEGFGWHTNRFMRLLQKKQFTTNEVAVLTSAQGAGLYSNMVYLLSHDWSLGPGVYLFRDGDHIRPALLQAVHHPSEYISLGSKKLLARIGHPDDIQFSGDSSWGPTRPTCQIAAESLDYVINGAVGYLLESHNNRGPDRLMKELNRAKTAAVVSFTGYDKFGGHFTMYGCYFALKDGVWNFEYWYVTMIE